VASEIPALNVSPSYPHSTNSKHNAQQTGPPTVVTSLASFLPRIVLLNLFVSRSVCI
jgi:hypothetical protein